MLTSWWGAHNETRQFVSEKMFWQLNSKINTIVAGHHTTQASAAESNHNVIWPRCPAQVQRPTGTSSRRLTSWSCRSVDAGRDVSDRCAHMLASSEEYVGYSNKHKVMDTTCAVNIQSVVMFYRQMADILESLDKCGRNHQTVVTWLTLCMC